LKERKGNSDPTMNKLQRDFDVFKSLKALLPGLQGGKVEKKKKKTEMIAYFTCLSSNICNSIISE
jgi:hypothetical protein